MAKADVDVDGGAPPRNPTDSSGRARLSSVGSLLLVWLTLSVSLVMLNKHVMTSTPCRFPLTLAFLHMSTGLVLAHACRRLFPAAAAKNNDLASEHAARYRYKVWAVGALLAGVLLTSNAAFARLDVAMIQMLKASTPVTIFVLGTAMRAEAYDHVKAINVLVIAFGVILSANGGGVTAGGVGGGSIFDAAGVALQMTSIFLDSLRCLLLQQVVSGSGVALDPLTALIHVAPSAVAVLLLPSMVLEWPALRTSTCIATSWGYLAISCAIAFSLNLVVCALIGATSALTTSVSGILKDFVSLMCLMSLGRQARDPRGGS